MTIVNTEETSCIKTKNATIMDYAVQHVRRKKLSEETLVPLNYINLCKQMILPCELAGLTGKKETKSWKNEIEKVVSNRR